ncbi:MAG: sulfotransferase family protein [Pseudomonadota bacterium]
MVIDGAAKRSYKRKVRAELWSNFSVVRHRNFDGMLVTSKNSGTHWIKYMLATALAEDNDIPPPEYFSEDAVRPYIGWPKDQPVFPSLPRLAFSHTIPHRLMDWRRLRQLIGFPNYVLAVRHPMAILASHYAKWAHQLNVDWLTFLEGDPSGERYRCDIYWLARFWNRWGDIVAADGSRYLIVRYEEALLNPETSLRSVSDHWQLGLSDGAIAVALRAGTKDAMADKIDPEAERNVLQNRKEALAEQFKGEALDLYRARVASLFRHDLGYDLLSVPASRRAAG